MALRNPTFHRRREERLRKEEAARARSRLKEEVMELVKAELLGSRPEERDHLDEAHSAPLLRRPVQPH